MAWFMPKWKQYDHNLFNSKIILCIPIKSSMIYIIYVVVTCPFPNYMHIYYTCSLIGRSKMMKLLCATFLILNFSSPMPVISSPFGAPHYQSIFSFGDSLADTGNGPVIFKRFSIFNPVTRPPYGSTFFGRPSGRDCDGRLIIDFIGK